MVEYTRKVAISTTAIQEQLDPLPRLTFWVETVYYLKVFTKYDHTQCLVQQIVFGSIMKLIKFSTKRATHLL